MGTIAPPERMAPQAVLFDCGNTILLPSAQIVKEVLSAKQQQQWANDLVDCLGLAADLHAVKIPRNTSIEPFYFWWRILSGIPKEVEDNTLRNITSRMDLYSVLNDSVMEVFRRLSTNNIKIAVVANAEGQTRAELEAYGLSKYVDTIIDSEEVGYRKPQVEIYEKALSALCVSPDKCYFVGDSLFNDVLGPSKAGLMNSLLFDPCGLYSDIPIRRITDLHDLFNFIRI